MLDFAALPPEVNSGLMYAGPGSGPMVAAAAAWDIVASDLFSTASAYGSVISDLVAVWLGPSSIAMAAAAAPFVSWIAAAAGLAEDTGTQATAAVAAYEVAFAMTVPPPVIAANRALLSLLVATNFFGQNTAAIMATEAHYMEMWAQDATAMYGYAAASLTASTLAPFPIAPLTTVAAGLDAEAQAAAQAAQTSAGTAVQATSQLSSLLSSQMTSVMSTQLTPMLSTQLTTATAPNLLQGATSATTMASSSSTSTATVASLPTALTAGASLASGAGSAGGMSTAGTAAGGSATSLLQSMGPTAGVFGGNFHTWGLMAGNDFGSGPGLFAAPNMSSVHVSAGVGRAASVGMLSVPQGWASAAPAAGQLGSVSSSISSASAAPAVAPSGPAGTPNMPMVPKIARGTGNAMAPPLRIGHRPTVVHDHAYGG